MHRSQHRRDLAEISRRHAPRRKGLSLAAIAALIAGPTMPILGTAAAADGHTDSTHPVDPNVRPPKMLGIGDTGKAVAAAQHELGVSADGQFGPVTQAAIRDFQERHGLPVTGDLDPKTWVTLFGSQLMTVEEGSAVANVIEQNDSGSATSGSATSGSATSGSGSSDSGSSDSGSSDS